MPISPYITVHLKQTFQRIACQKQIFSLENPKLSLISVDSIALAGV